MSRFQKSTWRQLTVVLAVTLVAAFTGCSKSDNSTSSPFTAVLDQSSFLSYRQTGRFLDITATGPWKLVVSYPDTITPWCTPDQTSGNGTMRVWLAGGANNNAMSRSLIVTVTLTPNNLSISNNLVQFGTQGVPILRDRLELPKIVQPEWIYEYSNAEFTLEYSTTAKHCKWVAWELDRSWFGSSGRDDNWWFDSRIPSQYTPTRNDFSGYDRGHMCPSADRTRNQTINHETFCYSNMLAQVGVGFNQDIWASLENKERAWVSNPRDTIYICSGGTIDPSDKKSSPSSMYIPKNFFKVILRKKGATGKFDAIGFWFENKSYGAGSTMDGLPIGTSIITSVRAIEDMTGIDFFYNLDKTTQDAVETTYKRSDWGL